MELLIGLEVRRRDVVSGSKFLLAHVKRLNEVDYGPSLRTATEAGQLFWPQRREFHCLGA